MKFYYVQHVSVTMVVIKGSQVVECILLFVADVRCCKIRVYIQFEIRFCVILFNRKARLSSENVCHKNQDNHNRI